MGFGESGESTPYLSGDKSTRLDKSEGARRATQDRQRKLEREAAEALKRKRRNGGGQSLIGSMALDGVVINSNSRFE